VKARNAPARPGHKPARSAGGAEAGESNRAPIGAPGGVPARHLGGKPRGRPPDREGISHSGAALAQPVGEIDIIARRRQLLIFVEVKARETLDDAAWSVTERQKARIVAAAQAWLARLGDNHGFQDMRFDAVLVAPGHIPRHIPAAFEAES